MNTRLQVEHPVTEAVFGIDLVALQLQRRRGRAPSKTTLHARVATRSRPACTPRTRPSAWAPQTGTLHRLAVPDGVRLDTGYTDGDPIGVHYDPMLAKVVAHAPTRAEALRKLAGALERADDPRPGHQQGPARTVPAAPGVHDGPHGHRLLRPPPGRRSPRPTPDPYAPLAAALADAHGRSRFGGGWRNLPSQPQTKRYPSAGTEHEVRYRHTRDGLTADGVRVVHADADLVVLEVDGVRRKFEVSRYGDRVYVNPTALTALPRFPDPTTQQAPGSLLAPMPGTVVRIAEGLATGAAVTAGQPLVWLEAMKMEHKITAPADRHAQRPARRPRPTGRGRRPSGGRPSRDAPL